MKKIFVKLMCIVCVILCVISITNCVVVEATSTGDIIKQNFTGNSGTEGSVAIQKILSAVLSIIRNAGVAIAVVVLMTIGAKYIVASAGDRADIKKYAINYVIGALILLGATGILSVVKTIIDESLQ